MSECVASNIRQVRAMISQEIMNKFFDELVAGVGDIPRRRFSTSTKQTLPTIPV